MPYSIPNVEERPFGAGRRAGPRDFDTGEGLEAIAQKVGDTGDLAMSLFEQEMDSRVLGALSGATRAMTDLDQSVQAEPDHNKRMGMYQAGSQKISQEFRKGVKYPKYQEAFDARFFQQMESGRIAVLDNVRNAKIASAQATLIMSVETQLDSAKNNPDPVRREEIYKETLMDISLAEKNGTLGPVAAARMKIQVGNAEETERIIFDSYALADEIYDQYPDHEKRREAIREVPAHMRDRVSVIVEGRYDREQAHEKEANDAQYIDVMKRAMTDMTTEELVDAELRARDTAMPWTPNQFAQLLSIIQERDNKGKTLDGKALEATTYDTLVRLAADPVTRPDFLNLNLRAEFGHVLSDTLIKTLETDQGKGASELDEHAMNEMDIALATMKLPINNAQFAKASEDDMRASLLFREKVEKALNRARHVKQQPLTRIETSTVIQGLKDEVVLKTGWFSEDTARLFEMTPALLATPTLVVPEAAEIAIRNGFPESIGDRQDLEALQAIRDTYALMLENQQEGSSSLSGLMDESQRAEAEGQPGWRANYQNRGPRY